MAGRGQRRRLPFRTLFVFSVSRRLLEQNKVGACGAYGLAGARVAVPFVGAATGAVAVAQLIRLASGQAAATLVQLGLGAP